MQKSPAGTFGIYSIRFIGSKLFINPSDSGLSVNSELFPIYSSDRSFTLLSEDLLLYQRAELQISSVKLTSTDTSCVISLPNPVFGHLLESSQWDDSNKWSNIGFGEEITQVESIEVPFTLLIWSSAFIFCSNFSLLNIKPIVCWEVGLKLVSINSTHVSYYIIIINTIKLLLLNLFLFRKTGAFLGP